MPTLGNEKAECSVTWVQSHKGGSGVSPREIFEILHAQRRVLVHFGAVGSHVFSCFLSAELAHFPFYIWTATVS